MTSKKREMTMIKNQMKMVIAKDISCVTYNVSFEKPLNPILGETF